VGGLGLGALGGLILPEVLAGFSPRQRDALAAELKAAGPDCLLIVCRGGGRGTCVRVHYEQSVRTQCEARDGDAASVHRYTMSSQS